MSRSGTVDGELAEIPAATPLSGDRALAARCVAGDPDAVEQLYRTHVGSVRAMARLHASLAANAEDLVHDAFVRALELMPRYRGEASLSAWIRGIAFNLARSERRRASRRLGLLRRHGLPPSHTPAAPDERRPLQTLQRLIERLPEPERDAFCLRSVQQLSLDEVSQLLGAAVSTVSDRDRRAKDKLRAWMEESE